MTVEVKSEDTQMVEAVVSHQEELENAVEEKKKEEEPSSALEEKKLEEEPGLESEEKSNGSEEMKAVEKSSSFKEERSFLSDLKEHEKKALLDLRAKLEEAILEDKIFKKEETKKKDVEKPKEAREEEEGEAKAEEQSAVEPKNEERDVSIWGVPLLPSKNAEATDVVLLKFLRAREFKVKEAFAMLRNSLQWRKDSNINSILNETELGDDFGAACYMDGNDREAHPVCYNVSGVFQDDEVCKKAFGSEKGREKFLRWRVQVMEKGIEKLDLKPGGVSKLLQITDLKNSVGPSKKELRDTMKQAVQILQDNYPEFVARNIFINVPFWYYAFHALLSPFLTQRTKSKFVFARSAKVTETLLKYIPAEAIPIQYGGFKRENDTEFSLEDGGVSELMVKAGSTETIEIPAPEAGATIFWDLIVLGWDVNYKEEFVPTDEGSYTIIVQKAKKMGGSHEETIRNSFRNNEPGKVVLSIENGTFKKKKVLFRYKVESS